MEDIQVLLYILAAVAYFVFMQWRKAFKDPQEPPPTLRQKRPLSPPQEKGTTTRQQPPRPATSFEDILRELRPKAEQEGRVWENTPARELAQEQPFAPAAEKPREHRSLEDKVAKPFSWENPAEAREAARQAQARQAVAFDAYTREAVPQNPYATLLRKPASMREAVILSEILNRKYN